MKIMFSCSEAYFLVREGPSTDDVGVAMGTVFQEIRPWAGFKAGDFAKKKSWMTLGCTTFFFFAETDKTGLGTIGQGRARGAGSAGSDMWGVLLVPPIIVTYTLSPISMVALT